jgi:hypothetical protein
VDDVEKSTQLNKQMQKKNRFIEITSKRKLYSISDTIFRNYLVAEPIFEKKKKKKGSTALTKRPRPFLIPF